MDPRHIEQAIVESRAFHDFLNTLFDDISKRDELKNVGLDRRAAAVSLRLYLGDSSVVTPIQESGGLRRRQSHRQLV